MTVQPQTTSNPTSLDQPDRSVTSSTSTAEPNPVLNKRGRIRRTRISAWWVGLITAAVLLIALLVFVAQNSQRVTIHYVGFNGHLSLAVALLLSAVAGVLLVAVPGTGRIIQLRRALKTTAASAKPR